MLAPRKSPQTQSRTPLAVGGLPHAAPASDRPTLSAAARLWRRAKAAARKAGPSVAAAALVFPTLMQPKAAYADGVETVQGDGYVQLGGADQFGGTASLANDGSHYILFQKWINEGVGYQEGFSSIGLHTTIKDWGQTHLFADNRVLITDHSRIGYNGLLGLRTLRGDGVLGGWIGFDSTESNNGFRYEQISFGGEALFPAFDLRANAYLPTSSDPNFVGFTGFGTAAPTFAGNNLLFTDPALFEESVGGWEAEIGTQILPSTRGYVGLYGLYPELQDSAIGVQGRAEVRVSEDLNVQFIGSNDDIYGGTFQVVAELQFSGAAGANILPCWDCGYRRHGQVRRRWPVATLATRGFATRAAQLNGDDLNFVFVDNQAGAGGDGSFESPFQGLPGVADGADFIIVDAGVGGTAGTIALQPGQSLLGEGKPILVNTDRGMFDAPGFNTVGARPTLIGDGSNPVIELASNSTVRSFNIVADEMTTAIGGSGLDNFVIDCVTATAGQGIRLTGAGGFGTISDSRFNASGRDGVFIASGSRSLTLDIDDVIIAGQGGDLNNGLFLRSGFGGAVRADVDDLRVTNATVAGVRGVSQGGSLNFDGRNVSVAGGVAGDGFRFEGDNASVAANLTNVSATGSGDGATLDVDGGTGSLRIFNGALGNMGGSGVVANVTDATGTLDLENVRVNDAGVDGVRVAADGSTFSAELDNINANRVGRTGVEVLADGGSTVVADIDNVSALSAGLDGVNLAATDGSAINARVVDATLDNVGRDGFGALADDSVVRIDADTISVDGAGFDGVDVAAVDGGTVIGGFNGLNASGVGDDAVAVGAAGNGNVRLGLNNVVAVGSGDNGLDVTAGMMDDPGDVRLNVTNADFSSSVNDNVRLVATAEGSRGRIDADELIAENSLTGSGILVSGVDGACAILEGTGITAGNNAQNNLDISALGDNADVRVLLSDVMLDDAGANGVAITGDDGLIRVGLDTATIRDSGANGIDVAIDDGTMARLELNEVVITGSGLDAIEIDATDGSRLVTQGMDLDLTGSGGFGIDSRADDGSVVSTQLMNVDAGDNAEGGARIDTGTQGSAARQVFILENGSLDNTGGSGLVANTESGSRADIRLTNVNASNNALDGVDANFDTGTGTVFVEDSSVSGNLGSGVDVFADNDSVVEVRVEDTIASANGEDGVAVASRNGSETFGRIDNVLAAANGRDGVRLLAMDEDSLLDFVISDTFGNNNGRAGLMVDATDGGQATVCVFGGAFSMNGTDGVNVFTAGDDSLADVLFVGTDADSNVENGFAFEGNNGATLIAAIRDDDGETGDGDVDTLDPGDDVSASMNGNEGLLFTSTDAEGAYLLMDGNDLTFDGNSAAGGNGATVRVTRAEEAGIRFVGSVTNAADDGLNVRIIDTVVAAVEIGDEGRMVDDGTMTDTFAPAPFDFTGNGGNGIDLVVRSNDPAMETRMDVVTIPVGKNMNATFRSLNVANNNASDNGDQGIEVVLENVVIAAGTLPSIDGNTASDNLIGDGVSVIVRDSNLPGIFSVSENTANNNPDFGVDLAILDSTVGTLRVDDNTTTGNGMGGVRVFIDPSVVNSGSMSGNTATMNGGDGMTLIVDESIVSDFSISDNLSALNAGRGLRVDVRNNSIFDGLRIEDNASGDVPDAGVLFNVLSQSRYSLENTSVIDSLLTSFTLDLSTVTGTPIIFDTIEPGASLEFQPLFGDDVTTGLLSVNGNLITPGTFPLEDDGGNDLDGGGVPDDQPILNLVYNNNPLGGPMQVFDPGEVFNFVVDTDFIDDPASVPLTPDFIGATATATFSNGQTLTGVLQQTVGGVQISLSPDDAIDRGFLRNTMGGVLIDASDSAILGFEFDNNRVQANGDEFTVAHGLEINLDNSELPDAIIRDNDILTNSGDGIRLLDPETQGGAIGFDLIDNRVSGNEQMGLNVRLDGDTAMDSDIIGNEFSNNDSFGVRVDLRDESFADLRVGASDGNRTAINSNADAGIGLSLRDDAAANFVVENADISGTTDGPIAAFEGDGIRVLAQDNARLNELRIGDPGTPGSVVIDSNAGNGLNLQLRDNAVLDDGRTTNNGLKIQQTAVTGNGDDGIDILRTGNAFLNSVFIRDADVSGNVGNGLNTDFRGGSVAISGSVQPLSIRTDIQDSTFNDNLVDGILARQSADVRTVYEVEDTTFRGNLVHGIDVGVFGTGTSDVIVRNVDISGLDAVGNVAQNSTGILLFNVGDGSQMTTQIENVNITDLGSTAVDNGGLAGIEIDTAGTATTTAAVNDVFIDSVGGDGVRLFAGDDSNLRLVSENVTASNSAGNGLELVTAGNGVGFITTTNLVTTDNGQANGAADAASGIRLISFGDSTLTADLTDTQSLRNLGTGLFQQAFDTSENSLTVMGTDNPAVSGGSEANSSFSFNGLTGLFSRNGNGTTSDADLILKVQDSAFVGNGDDGTTPPFRAGLYFDRNEMGTGQSLINRSGNFFSGNAGQGLLIE